MTQSLTPVLNAYTSAWREPDDARRMGLLEQAWAENAIYTDPTGEAVGRDALSRHIAQFHAQWPGARIDLTGQPSAHGHHLFFTWQMLTADGDVAVRGVDYGTLDDTGRLSRIVGFFLE